MPFCVCDLFAQVVSRVFILYRVIYVPSFDPAIFVPQQQVIIVLRTRMYEFVLPFCVLQQQ